MIVIWKGGSLHASGVSPQHMKVLRYGLWGGMEVGLGFVFMAVVNWGKETGVNISHID